MTTLTKQTKAAWEALKKRFLREKNGKITRQVRYFQGGKAGHFLVEGNHSIYLGRNEGLAYSKLLTLDPNKSIESNDLLHHKAEIATIALVPSKKSIGTALKREKSKPPDNERWEETEPIETIGLDDFYVRCFLEGI